MKKIFKFMMILVVGLGFIACTPVSNGPEPILPPDPYDGPTYEIKFEGVETEYWLEDVKNGIALSIIDESKVKDAVLDCIESHKPSFETKTLKENEEYILEDYNKWIFGNEENPDLKLEVQYFADEELTSPIEPGSVIKNENKTIYIKFVWYLYLKVYIKQ